MENEAFIEMAKAEGYSEDEISTFLTSRQEATNGVQEQEKQTVQTLPQEENQVIAPTAQEKPAESLDFTAKALQEGYTEEEIQAYLAKQKTPEVTGNLTTDQVKENKLDRIEDLTARIENIHSRHATFGKRIVGVFNDDMALEANKDIYALNQVIIQRLKENDVDAFIDPNTNELMANMPDGSVQAVEPGFLDSMGASKFEIAGAVGGAIGGAQLGSALGPLGTIGGGLVGGALGAFSGSGMDYVANAIETKEELEGDVALAKMVDAGAADPVYAVLGSGILRGAGAVSKKTWKLLDRSFNVLKNGNVKGAKDLLLKDFGITEDQASELVKNWERLGSGKQTTSTGLGKVRELVTDEKTVKAIVETRPGAENVVANLQDTFGIVREIDKRAQDVLKMSNKLSKDNIGKVVKESLNEYTNNVKTYYSDVKNAAANIIDKTDYRFKPKDLTVEPIIENIMSRTGDPYKQTRFKAVMEKIASLNQSRTFSDLLELRQTVNSLSKTAKDNYSQEGFKKVLNTVDKEIKKTADEYLPAEQSNMWIKEFRNAKKQYSKMKRMEENVLYKALTKKGVTEDQIIKTFNNRIPALDETFIEVMEKLPVEYSKKVEGAVAKSLSEKYTAGLEGELRATHFPMLAKHLKTVPFKSKAAKEYTEVINEFAKVFKNDINLSRVSGQIQVPAFQSYLTTNVAARAKYEIASSLFNHIKQFGVGRQADNIALIKVAGRLMENPMNTKSISELMSKIPKDKQPAMQNLVGNLQNRWLAAGNRAPQNEKFYKVTKQDNIARTGGEFGPGYYLTDTVGNPKVTQRGYNIIRHDVASTELAKAKTINSLYKREVLPTEYKKLKGLQNKLKLKGYKGINIDGKVVLFDKPDL